MFRYFAFIVPFALFILYRQHAAFPIATKEEKPTPQETYKQYCASCHGGTVATFVDRDWKHGQTKADIVTSIKNGWPTAGMPAFGATLKKKEIDALADYILTGFNSAKQYDFAEKKTPGTGIFKNASLTVRLDTLAADLECPWGMAFLPNGDLLFTERKGQVYRLGADRKKQRIDGVPPVLAQGQGGLLDIELHPKFAENGWVYLSYAKFRDTLGKKESTTAIARGKLVGNTLTEVRDIFVAQPWAMTRHHYGSRIEFDQQGYLFFTVGDRGQHVPGWPQQLTTDAGKVHRLHDDGRVPSDNPFAPSNPKPLSIYSYGHRNPQGLAMDPATGRIWEHEHGPRGGDETNLIDPGHNYGWPVISYGINYDGTILTRLTVQEGMDQPATYWVPSIAPCGMTFVRGDRYPAWKGSLLVGSMRFNYLNRCVIRNNKIAEQELVMQNIGRVRCVEMGHDGYLYVGTEDKPGGIFRLVPVGQ
jgi:aldose sugar dehydrogenase